MLESASTAYTGLATKLEISLGLGTTYDSLFYFYGVLHSEMQHCIRIPRLWPSFRHGLHSFQSLMRTPLRPTKSQ